MTITLRRIGDELGLMLDAATLDRYGITEQTPIVVTLGDEGILLQPVRFATDAQVEELSDQIMDQHAETLHRLAQRIQPS